MDLSNVNINDKIDHSKTCKIIRKNEMDLNLQALSVIHIVENNSKDLEWNNVLQKINAYCK